MTRLKKLLLNVIDFVVVARLFLFSLSLPKKSVKLKCFILGLYLKHRQWH